MRQIDSEKAIEKRLAEGVKAKGGIALKYPSSYANGMPDRIILMPGGRISFVELKTTGKKPTKLQELQHSRLRSLGFQVVTIDTLVGVENYLKEL